MEEKEVYAELSSIRDLMERSSKFISLSGLSGILVGVYALLGAGLAYMVIKNHSWFNLDGQNYTEPDILMQLFLIAFAVLVLSIMTSFWLAMRKAKRRNENVWNPVSKRLLVASDIPFLTCGLFIAILLLRGEYPPIASACLIFYGLALVAGSQYTFNDVKWLGIGEILLGLLALFFPGYGLIFWTIGFGLLHILYGSIMYYKYER